MTNIPRNRTASTVTARQTSGASLGAAAVSAEEGTSGAATLAGTVYQQLRNDIISGRLLPGSPLRLEALRGRYGTGLSPIREALSRLSSDTFVTGIENRGYRVAEISRDDLADITEARVLIECEALRQSIALGDEQWETGILGAHYRLSKIDSQLRQDADRLIDAWEAGNKQFHDALVAACTSRWIQRFRTLLHDQSKRYRQVSLLRSASFRRIQDEHEKLMTATLARDAATACALMSAHIRATADYVMNSLPGDGA